MEICATRVRTDFPPGVDKPGVRLYEGGVSSAEVVLRRDGRVATITIDRSSDQKRLTREVLLALQSHVDAAVRASHTKLQILGLVRTANRLYDSVRARPSSRWPAR